MTTVPETKVVPAEVREASKEKRGDREIWGLKLKVPFSQYPIPTSMPLTAAAEVFKGETYMVKLQRGRLAKEDYSGDKEFHYFWDVLEWNTQAAATPATAASNGNRDDVFRTKEELRWTEAVGMAVSLHGPAFQIEGESHLERTKIIEWADWLYDTLAHAPAPVEPATPTSPNGTEDPNICQEHQVPYDHRSARTSAVFHDFGDQACVKGKGLVALAAPAPQEPAAAGQRNLPGDGDDLPF